MAREIKFGNCMIGDGYPAYVIAENGFILEKESVIRFALW